MTIIKTFDTSEEPQKSFPKRYFVFTIFGLIVLTLIEIWANNTVVSYGSKFEKLSILQKNLQMENLILQNDIAKNSSLVVIASKSAELGFSSTQSIQYIR